jgi:hypothetical protein
LEKMNHAPAIFFRPATAGPDKNVPWVRLEGFTEPKDLLRELNRDNRRPKVRN